MDCDSLHLMFPMAALHATSGCSRRGAALDGAKVEKEEKRAATVKGRQSGGSLW